jgi:hypothetical protein
MRFSEEDLARLKAFAEGGFLAPIGTGPSARVLRNLAFAVGAAGFEPATSRV